MASALLPKHLTPLPCLLSHINWLPHHPLIISTSRQNMLPLLPPHLCDHPSLCFHTPTPPYASASPPHPFHSLPCSRSPHAFMICLQFCHPMSALTHPYTFQPPLLTILMLPQHHQDMSPTLPTHVPLTPAAYVAYAPAGPSRYSTNAATPCPPSPILTLLPPAAYNAYALPGPSRYATNTATPFTPSPILTLPPTLSSLPLTIHTILY
ncbi:hypothetical protein O181_022160 [Austropuccinia psidii MF-1]|uniref:Uncharacterized protein n=1 Tax=Austropuccinia psidii MF-1 TaxID=1389203 RepID=A0A9Q3CGX1_9BASI|nr:hypothetical protein [Austropuccinia psidii MF-1]